jgi:protein-glutamine gamma-glutamyltransferase
MKFPRFLLGLAILFWGFEVHMLVAAVPIALVLELPFFLKARWDFSDTDLNRIWDLCAVLFMGIGVVIASTHDAAKASFQFIQYMPFAFVPIVAAQRYGTQETLKWSVFSWFLRRTPNAIMSRKRVDVNWVYFAICLFAASATHDANPIFYPAFCVLVAYALMSVRPSRMRIVPWLSLFVLIAGLGHVVHIGLFHLETKVQNVFDEWIADMFKRDPDSRESHTNIGKKGRIKLSGKIVMRVHPEGNPLPPALIREAAYDTYAKGVWRGVESEFAPVYGGNDETAELLPKKKIVYSARIARNLSSKSIALALPHGTFGLRDVGTMVIKTNKLGFARCESDASFINFVADYGPGETFDSPPNDLDTNVPPTEHETFKKIANELSAHPVFKTLSEADKMQAVVDHFRAHFKYSTEILAQSIGNRSALDVFMNDVRAGHCEYFATSTSLLLRELKIPARYVTGYSVQPSSRKGDTYLIRARHAHSWVVAYDKDRKIWLEVDSTPPSWDETVDGEATLWEPISDFFSNLYFQYSKWRWGKESYTKYLPALLVPLIGILVWRIVRNKRGKHTIGADTETIRRDWPGLDSEFFSLEKKLHEAGLGRVPSEPLLHWHERLRRELPPNFELERLLKLHRRLRFDPNGLSTEERSELRAEAKRLLVAFDSYQQSKAALEQKKSPTA